jgi:hypothetical protein
MDAGDAACSHGLSNRIYANWTGDAANNGFSNPLSGAQQTSLKSMCYAIALAVVAEIQANATAVIATSATGLQRDNTAGNPATLGPAATKTLPIQ